MNKLKELLAALLLAESNFKVLHWNAHGKEFDSTHVNITTTYYDLCSDKADVVAEMLIRMGGTPVNHAEVVTVLNDSNRHYNITASTRLYDKEEIISAADDILGGIVALIEECLASKDIAENPHNVGIKASLEGLHDEFDIQWRYINKRRK